MDRIDRASEAGRNDPDRINQVNWRKTLKSRCKQTFVLDVLKKNVSKLKLCGEKNDIGQKKNH